MKIRLILFLLSTALFWHLGGWTGFYVNLIMWAGISCVIGPPKETPQERAETTQHTPRNDGILVPAKRGKPDPTRPNWRDEMSGNHYERKFHD